MYVILSQRIDFDSSYADELFNSYHYPSKYKNQLHKGDIFIYYQGNRYDKSQRYYFGVGTVGEIITSDGENYYAKLIDCQQFEKKYLSISRMVVILSSWDMKPSGKVLIPPGRALYARSHRKHMTIS